MTRVRWRRVPAPKLSPAEWAWEFLRRNPEYREEWAALAPAAGVRVVADPASRRWGLVYFLDPELEAVETRPGLVAGSSAFASNDARDADPRGLGFLLEWNLEPVGGVPQFYSGLRGIDRLAADYRDVPRPARPSPRHPMPGDFYPVVVVIDPRWPAEWTVAPIRDYLNRARRVRHLTARDNLKGQPLWPRYARALDLRRTFLADNNGDSGDRMIGALGVKLITSAPNPKSELTAIRNLLAQAERMTRPESYFPLIRASLH
jgi:hypothetical protein